MKFTSFTRSGAYGSSLIPSKSILLEHRIIYIDEEITSENVSNYIQQILILSFNSSKDIFLIINTPSGNIQDGLALIDVMKSCGCKIRTIALGIAASMGAIILAAGDKGYRYITSNSRIMIHEPLIRTGIAGTCSDVQAQSEMLLERKHLIVKLLNEYTGQDVDTILKAISYDNYMNSLSAKEFHLVDHILDSSTNITELLRIDGE